MVTKFRCMITIYVCKPTDRNASNLPINVANDLVFFNIYFGIARPNTTKQIIHSAPHFL